MATEYLILKADAPLVGGDVIYTPVGTATASGAISAARAVVPKPEEDVEYIAVPTGNWTSLKPTVKNRDPIVEWVETKPLTRRRPPVES